MGFDPFLSYVNLKLGENFFMENVTPTVYGSAIQTALYLGLTPTFLPNSTLNEYFGVQAGAALGSTDKYNVGYIALGNGGHTNVTGADGFPLSGENRHQPGDVRCFKPLPFIMRLVTNDLNIEERKRFAMRRLETHGGRQYFAYYLRRINKTPLQVTMQKLLVRPDGTTQQPFIPNSNNLNPVPVQVTTSTGSVITTSADYLTASCVMDVVFDANDAAELRNCAEIIYGDERYAIISEVVTVAGADRTVSGAGPGSTNVNYMEAVCCQPTTFLVTETSMVTNNNGYTFTLDVGATEPLLLSN